MKTLLALVLLLSSLASASAQDQRGRERRPPSSGGSSSGGSSSGGSSSGRSGGERSTPPPQRSSPPHQRETGSRQGGGRDANGGGAVARRRAPADRPNQTDIDGIRHRSGSPDRRPTADSEGRSLGHAVRRDSLPPRDIGGVDMGRHRNERERGRYYWHHYNGYRYSHYVDPYGYDWYFWYHGDAYWEMQYHSGRWWRYDARYGRWCYFHHDHWYWHDGHRVYVYREDRNDYVETGDGGSDWSGEVKAPDWSVTGNVGFTSLKSLGNRGAGDVLEGNAEFLDFDGSGLQNRMGVNVEVNRGLGRHAEASVGVGYFSGSVNSNYRDYVNDNGAEIAQRLSVTNVPVSATVKVMPWGRDQRIQPYVGGGVQLNNWRYTESGQFIDFNSPNADIYRETYTAKGMAAGPVALAGLRVPLDRERAAIGVEYRHSWAQGKLGPENGFAGDRLDLGGGTLNVGVTISLDRKK